MKICFTCKIEKPLEEFYRNHLRKDGRAGRCILCTKNYTKENSSLVKEQRQKSYKKTRERPGYIMYCSAKSRAAKKDLVFTIELEDIIIPQYCPVFPWIKLEQSTWKNGGTYNSPSLDRLDNSKGYTKDNIRVISMKANNRKSDMSIEEVEAILSYMRGKNVSK